jgi:CheY-like chemotaxis protein
MGNSRDLRLAGIHVVAVDDHEDALYVDVLAAYLQHHAASVVTAQSGGEALAILKKSWRTSS